MRQCAAGTGDICPLFAFAAPTLSPDDSLRPTTPPPPTAGTDAPVGSPVSFPYFPVLAGLQVLGLLAMTGAVLWVTLRGGSAPPRNPTAAAAAVPPRDAPAPTARAKAGGSTEAPPGSSRLQ